jgi:phosphatidylserine/phosphatidylglycerophosphate/cardiolipin synthase-like enzyme
MTGSLVGFTAHFNSDGTRLDGKLIEALRDAEAKAREGKRLDLNMTIFQFQSVPIAEELLRIARENPNARLRIIGDWSQSSNDGNNRLPLIERQAASLGLRNIDIRYKKDEPYQWDEGKERPVFAHSRARGLVHRKGFVALVDGVPVKMAFGSFNWSETADSKNYEDLVIVDPVGEVTEAMALQYEREFAAFVNHPDALTGAQARAFKRDSLNRMRSEHGRDPGADGERDAGPEPEKYVSPARSAFDVNSFAADDAARLDALVGQPLADEVRGELRERGRFDSYLDLAARIPRIDLAPAEARQALALAGFGEGRLAVNTAPTDDWVRLGFPPELAGAIIDHRARHDGFLSVADLAHVPGVTAERLAACRHLLTDDVAEGFYTARGFDDPAAATGYDPDNASRTVVVAGADSPLPASVTNAAVDLLRRAGPGDTVRIAMYIFQTNTPEFRVMLAANDRGATVKLVLSEEFRDLALPALSKELAAGRQGLEVRVQTARTLHEKFMVAGNDVFTGSANIASSASERHSEDRYVIRNHPPFAHSYINEFERVFGRSKDIGAKRP